MATAFLRTIGLDSLNFASRNWSRRRAYEQPKVVISRSLGDTLARCSLHFIPCAVSATIIALNCRGLYLGPSLVGSAEYGQGFAPTLVQLAAKIQEVFIVSSLGLIIIHFIRYELLYGQGTSLGFLFAGLNFARLSYFWSPSFCNGWTFGRGGLRLQKFLLILLVVSSGIIASFAGPASALLMMPLAQRWTYRNDNIPLAGTESQLFPRNLTISNVGGPNCANGVSILNSGQRCLNNGFAALFAYWRNRGPNYWDGLLATIYDDFSNGRTMKLHNPPNTTQCTWTYMPHAAVSAMLKDIWWDPTWKSNLSSSGGYAEVKAPAPWVRVKCSDPYKTNLSHLEYPVLPQADDWDGKTYASLDLSAGMLDFLNSVPHQAVASPYTTFWNLPEPSMGFASAGLTTFLRNSGDDTTDSNLQAFSCTVDARWVESNTSKGDAGTAGIVASADIKFDYSNQESMISPISMDLDWLDNLTPQIHYWDFDASETSNTTGSAMGALLSAYWLGARDFLASERNASRMVAEAIISSYITEGISRVGLFEYITANKSQDALNADNSQTFRLHTSVTGFAYSIRSASDYYAISVPASHMLIAAVFVVYLLFTRETSGCWDSIEEIFALAHNSRPDPSALANTSAGIHQFHTMSQNVRIRALYETNEPQHLNAETLQLVFGSGGADTIGSTVMREVKYGQTAQNETAVYQGTELFHRRPEVGNTSTQSLLSHTIAGGEVN